MTAMNTIDRYDHREWGMERSPIGDWIAHEAHAATIEQLHKDERTSRWMARLACIAGIVQFVLLIGVYITLFSPQLVR